MKINIRTSLGPLYVTIFLQKYEDDHKLCYFLSHWFIVHYIDGGSHDPRVKFSGG